MTDIPAQHQDRQPGRTDEMQPHPRDSMKDYKPGGKLKGKRALITGGDSGIGRAVAIGMAKEGADIAILYLEEDSDAEATKQMVEQEGARCLTLRGDIGEEAWCQEAVEKVVAELGGLDILVNNAAEQHPKSGIEEISAE